MRLQQTKHGQLFLNLPKSIATANDWKKGDNLQFILNNRGEWVIRRIN